MNDEKMLFGITTIKTTTTTANNAREGIISGVKMKPRQIST